MHEFPCTAPIAVDIRVAAGVVEVHAEPRETVTVEVAPFDDSDLAGQAAEATRVELTGGTLLVAAPEPRAWQLRRTPKLRVVARVPAASSGRLRAASADLTCTGQWSQIRLQSASGDLTLRGAAGRASLNTASGDIRVGEVDGALSARTASGDVSVRRAGGPVDASTASGTVQIEYADDDVRVKTASGNASVGSSRRGTVRMRTVSGDVTVGVLPGTGVWLDLNTVAGRAHSDLAMGGGDQVPAHDLTLSARTVSGNIHVHRAAAAPAT